jgi:methylated-DNA-protein-cysteine methyltransferase-like protein
VVEFDEAVLRVLRGLPRGQTTSYGEVAADAGYPRAARAVGNLLRQGPVDVPWWRVVRSDGRLAAPHAAEQARLLRAEGVRVVDGRVARAPVVKAPGAERPAVKRPVAR